MQSSSAMRDTLAPAAPGQGPQPVCNAPQHQGLAPAHREASLLPNHPAPLPLSLGTSRSQQRVRIPESLHLWEKQNKSCRRQVCACKHPFPGILFGTK